MAQTVRPHIVWRPLKGFQTLAISCPCNHLLLQGTRAAGKTDVQLMRFRRNVGVGYGPFWRGILFDEEYKNLDDIVVKSTKWLTKFGDGAKFNESVGDYRWWWPTGEELLFRQIKKKKDYLKYHGHEIPWLGWNELTKYATPDLYDDMMSCNRTGFLPEEHSPRDPKTNEILRVLPPIPLEVVATTNPWGPGRAWVKKRFIDAAPAGRIVRVTTKVFDPRTERNIDVTKTQTHLFGSYRENRYLDAQYIADLAKIKDPDKKKAWLKGDWNNNSGGMFGTQWRESVHQKKRFKIPKTWYVNRTLDWGSSTPFSVGWWAEANGEAAEMADGSTFCPPAGTLIRIHEWYGSEDIGTNIGLGLPASVIARKILEIEQELYREGWVNSRIWAGPADNQIRQVTETETETIEKKMAREGVEWTVSDKSPGSRVNGVGLFRDRLEASITGDGPAFYVFEHCRAAIAILPNLPRSETNPEDVSKKCEDHPWDETRYRILDGSGQIAIDVVVVMPQ